MPKATGHTVNHPSEGYTRYYCMTSDYKKFYDWDACSKWGIDNELSQMEKSEYVETKKAWSEYIIDTPAKPGWDELIGYKCSIDGTWKSA